MITREWGKRRITIQCNVRGRDVGSFVAEAQHKLAAEVELPGDVFRLEWGGQFENMLRAQRRLSIVVPLALGLIVGLLYLTYRNVPDTVSVFASVPFACIGGVIALSVRELPLSISAAVGFITLSGVSVLSSMILTSAWRTSKVNSTPCTASVITDAHSGPNPATILGNENTLIDVSVKSMRTILLTALVASVGFIPMAVSDGSGAEIQRPLATVVIGGVIGSSIFTLFLLPILFKLRDELSWSKS